MNSAENPAIAVEPTDDAPLHAPLGNIAASGFAWNVVLTIGTKLLGIISQIFLARLLLKNDFGAYTESLITIAIASIIRDTALNQVLVTRQKELDAWENAGFWMSLALGIISGLIVAVIGVRFAMRADGGVVARLLWIGAIGSPIIAAGTVSIAKLQGQLRFRILAQISAAAVVGAAILSVVMAKMHFGAYSLMFPQIAAAVVKAFIFLWLAPPKLHFDFEFAKWISLATAGAMVTFIAFGVQVVGQGDNVIISSRFGKDAVGVYGFAFNLSIQTIVLLTTSLAQVLLPTLTRLNDEPRRQIDAYLRACRVLAVAGVPLCGLQLLFAKPMVVPVFGAQWADAAILLQVLSVGMAFALVNSFSGYVLQAQHALRLLSGWTALCMVVFLMMALLGVKIGGVIGVAAAVSTYHCVMGTLGMRLAMRGNGSFADLFRVFMPALVACAIASLPVTTFPLLFPHIYHGQAMLIPTLAAVGAYSILFFIIYATVISKLAPDAYAEIASRFEGIARRVKSSPGL